jgi:hypothetical protein
MVGIYLIQFRGFFRISKRKHSNRKRQGCFLFSTPMHKSGHSPQPQNLPLHHSHHKRGFCPISSHFNIPFFQFPKNLPLLLLIRKSHKTYLKKKLFDIAYQIPYQSNSELSTNKEIIAIFLYHSKQIPDNLSFLT